MQSLLKGTPVASARRMAVMMAPLAALFLAASPFSAPDAWDQAGNLVDELRFTSLEEMRGARLEQAQLQERPWSGWFYPLNEGSLANRYADPNFPKNAPWSAVQDYITRNAGHGSMDLFSPAEKYDLLLNDKTFTLTRNLTQIAAQHVSQGQIDAWLGYCTGWASAAMMRPRPAHSVTAVAADGKTKIKFRPSDVKALAALLGANGNFATRVAGRNCGQSPVARDPQGRPTDPDCRSDNPATWHLSIVNQVGVSHRSLIIDSDPGHEIWNQPVVGYHYTYFNPSTGQAGALERSTVALKDFKNDRFAAFRASGTAAVVGVEMSLTFVYEKRPDASDTDTAATDETRVPVYKYDLELDSSGRIIGGEWWTQLHPNVLWLPALGSQAVSDGDSALSSSRETWNAGKPPPPMWVQAARASETYAQPLGHIVDRLFEWAAE